MVDMKFHQFVSVAIFIAIIFPSFAVAGNEDSLGRLAEKEGRLKQALTHYVSALQEVWKKKGHSQELVDKIISLNRKLDSPLSLPEEAKRHIARGRAALKAAQDKEGFLRAVDEFEKATYHAPWYAENYYNLGIVRDKAGKYADAIWALNMYLQAKPGAGDAEQVKSLIYEVEYRKEEASRKKNADAEKQEVKRRQQSLSGTWEVRQWDDWDNRPTRYGTWAPKRGRSKKFLYQWAAKVDVQGTNIEIIMSLDIGDKFFNRRLVFKGTIKGTKINGKLTVNVYNKATQTYCPPQGTAVDFEGSVWFEEKVIMLVTPGTYYPGGYMGNECNYINKYIYSFLLEK